MACYSCRKKINDGGYFAKSVILKYKKTKIVLTFNSNIFKNFLFVNYEIKESIM